MFQLQLYMHQNQDSPDFFSSLGETLRERHENKIIIGDFNLTMDVEMDRENTYCNNNKARDEVFNICDRYCLKELWRERNEHKREFSWMKANQFPIKASRIDFALISGGLDQKTELIQYLSSIFTDHRAVYMVLELNKLERGVGYWKFNTSLLQDEKFILGMNQELETTIITTQHMTAIDRWEKIKERIRKVSKKYAAQNSSATKLIISQLSEKVNEYESRLPLNKEENTLLENTKMELEEKTLERIKGVMFRSKAKWYEQGEKNTKYFYSLEKAKYNAKTCFKLIDTDGNEYSDNSQILEQQRRFYAELYQEDKFVEFNLTNKTNIKVPQEVKQTQDIQLTIKDLASAIKRMNNNKTPGQDGIPVDFYKVFWNTIKECFFQMVMETYRAESLHQTARQGILNLIPKPGKDSRHIKNLRPITLLNTDYKIIEKAVADKMIPALEHIIHKDQRGFMKDRRISVNIRKMLDIIHEAEKDDLEAIILSLDFVKCFDKCSFSILFGSLDFFGFGSIVKEWTKILYHNFSVKVQNNGNFSQQIPISKGVHQGGCCSSIYFLVIAEILAIALRENQNIEGITIKDIRNILNQFADDMDIFSIANRHSIEAIYNELESFRLQSGFTVSYEKTTLYRIGSLRHSDAQMYDLEQFKWSNKDINVLGVTITHDNLIEKNYNSIIEKARETLSAWQNRGLTLLGRVQVVNTMIASLFVYKMMVLPQIPKTVVKNMDNLIRNYLWGGKKSKIAYNILQLPKKEGGLNLVNLQKKDTSLKATWPQILHNETEYAKLVYRIIRCRTIEEDIWRCNISPEDVNSLKFNNQFWKDVLISWSEYNYYQEARIENQILWYNSRIKVHGQTVFWRDCYQKGLIYVHQLFEERKFKNNEQLSEQYSLTTLRINSLKSAICKEWKNFFQLFEKQQYMPLPPHTYDRILQQDKSLSKEVYSFLAEDIIILHNKYIKWKEDLEDYNDTLIDFRQEFNYINRVTNVTKYRSFQYRLLQRGLITNIHLEKWNILPSSMCTFCSRQPETVIHLMWHCPKVQIIWENVQAYIQEQGWGECHNLQASDIIMNRIHRKRSHVINFICLITKQYIYSSRCLKKEIHFPVLKAMINSVRNTEKYIAIKNSKLSTHHRKWTPMADPQSINDFINQYASEL